MFCSCVFLFFFSSRRRHTRCALVTGVQTCALPICRGTLIDIYGADAEQIEVIEHGTPERPFAARSPLCDTLGVGYRPILSTFGLIGPGKGLEAAIRALPAITEQYPDILNRLAVSTHPHLKIGIASSRERE